VARRGSRTGNTISSTVTAADGNMPIHGPTRPFRVHVEQGADDCQVFRNVVGSPVLGWSVSAMVHVAPCSRRDDIAADLECQSETAARLGDLRLEAARQTDLPRPPSMPGSEVMARRDVPTSAFLVIDPDDVAQPRCSTRL
jgi:hypothetical protein